MDRALRDDNAGRRISDTDLAGDRTCSRRGPVSMRVEFDATLDDLVDVHLRLLARSRVARGWCWSGSIATGLVAGSGLLILIPELFSPLAMPWEVEITLAILLAVLGGIVAAAIYPSVYRRIVATRLRRYCREQLRSDAPFTVEVQLLPGGIRAQQLGTEIACDWANVKAIEEGEDSVDFVVRSGGIIAVQDRAFASSTARREFVELARHYRDEARSSADRSPDL
jgi:hypothetical protein